MANNSVEYTLNDYQKTLHNPENVELGTSHSGNQVLSDVYFTPFRSTWYSSYEESMKLELDFRDENTQSLRFHLNSNAHGVVYSHLNLTFPSIKCKDGYEVRWSRFPLLKYIKKASFKIDDLVVNSFDHVWLDMYINNLIGKEDVEDTLINIGHTSDMIEWHNELPSKETSFSLPWFYNSDMRQYFPLDHCGSLTKIYHELQINGNVESLLQIRKVETGENASFYDAIEMYDMQKVKSSLEKVKLPQSVMYGQYIMLSEHECDYRRCLTQETKKIEINYNDVECFDAQLPVHAGREDIAVLPIKSKFPLHYMGWVCENYDAIKDGCASNYSTNDEHPAQGTYPYKNSTLTAQKDDFLIQNMSTFRSSRVHPGKFGKCLPREPGYSYWSNSLNVKSLHPRPGKIFKDGNLIVQLGVQEDNKRFAGNILLKARGLVSKTLRIEYTEEEKCKYTIIGASE